MFLLFPLIAYALLFACIRHYEPSWRVSRDCCRFLGYVPGGHYRGLELVQSHHPPGRRIGVVHRLCPGIFLQTFPRSPASALEGLLCRNRGSHQRHRLCVPAIYGACWLVRGATRCKDPLPAGTMQQGFCWEYVARVHRRGFSIRELPVHHRLRSAGTTRVYKLRKPPGIGWLHVLALFRILKETRSSAPRSSRTTRA